MNNQDVGQTVCPLLKHEIWVNFNMSDFHKVGSFKLSRLSTAQKNDLFLAVRNAQRGSLKKIASFLGMDRRNMQRMLHMSKEYQEFIKAEQSIKQSVPAMTYSGFPELPKDETEIQSSSGICDKNLTEAALFEPELDLTDGTQLELEIEGADARAAVTEASQLDPDLACADAREVTATKHSPEDSERGNNSELSKVASLGAASSKDPCPLHIPSLEATWSDIANGNLKTLQATELHDLPNSIKGPCRQIFPGDSSEIPHLQDMPSRINVDDLLPFQNALQDRKVGIGTIDGTAQALRSAVHFKTQRYYKCFCIDEGKALEHLKHYEAFLEGSDTDSDDEKRSAASSRTDARLVPRTESADISIPTYIPDSREISGIIGTAKGPTIHGILLVVYMFLISIHEGFEYLFNGVQRGNGNLLQTTNGDHKRLQKKLFDMHEPSQEAWDTPETFNCKLAGFWFLRKYMSDCFYDILTGIPRCFSFHKDFDPTFAAVLLSKLDHEPKISVNKQPLHTDKEPDKLDYGVSALCNLSVWLHWFTCLLGSAHNIKALLQAYKSEYEPFIAELKKKYPNAQDHKKYFPGTTNERYWHAWQCYLQHRVPNTSADFIQMELAQLGLKQLTWVVFDMDFVHGGGDYPGRIPKHIRNYALSGTMKKARKGIQKKTQCGKKASRWSYRIGRLHFRWQKKQI